MLITLKCLYMDKKKPTFDGWLSGSCAMKNINNSYLHDKFNLYYQLKPMIKKCLKLHLNI